MQQRYQTKRLAVDNLIRGEQRKLHEQLKKHSISLYHNFSIFKYLITTVVECVSYNLNQEQSEFFLHRATASTNAFLFSHLAAVISFRI